jgi:phage antirepressor YoqD-like protein
MFKVLSSEKQHDLGSLKRIQLEIYNSYDHEFLRAKTRLEMEQHWYRSTSLITPKTRRKNLN